MYEEFLTPQDYNEEDGFYETEIAHSAFDDFVTRPSKETVQLLDNDELKLLVAIATQVEKGIVKDITIEDEYGHQHIINSKLSKQILNYINGYRVKCDFGRCNSYMKGNINVPYEHNDFFSLEECESRCVGMPEVLLDEIDVGFIEGDKAILDSQGRVIFASSGNIVPKSKYHLIKKLVVRSNKDIYGVVVRFPGNFTHTIQLFTRLTHLNFGEFFNQPIDQLKLPSSLTHLDFNMNFDQPVDQLELPSSLTHLTFDGRFNQPVDQLKLPSSLTHLTFDGSFNQPVDQLKLPLSLTHLNFLWGFEQPVNQLKLPSSLTHLTFGGYFDQPVDQLELPSSLTHLTFGGRFNQPVEQLKLPSSLTHLTFGILFNQPIDQLKLPSSLTHLVVPYLDVRGTILDQTR